MIIKPCLFNNVYHFSTYINLPEIILTMASDSIVVIWRYLSVTWIYIFEKFSYHESVVPRCFDWLLLYQHPML